MSIEVAIFRSNPRYELVLLDRLSLDERSALSEIEDDGLYGVLRAPNGTGLPPRGVSEETALLFLTLHEPGPLPAYVRRRLGVDIERTATRLVLDEVLEVHDEGGYVSGPSAAALLRQRSDGDGNGALASLSIDALRYGQALGTLPVDLLALRLYLYGRRPVTAALRRRFPDAAAVAGYLGVCPRGAARPALDESWIEAVVPGEPPAWRLWRPRRRLPPREPNSVDYKLYVSTSLHAAPAAVRIVAETLADARGTTGFKIGRDLDGLCRPDKLVAYFARLEDLHEAAALLGPRVAECPPHGVPFTAPIDPEGLLSWGIDPPRRRNRSPGSSSWRLWVVTRLAEYLAAARGATAEGWQFALERLRLDGVDTSTWVPTKAAREGQLVRA